MQIQGVQMEGLSEQALAEVVALYQETGGLTARALVAWAQENPQSALYGEFEWDEQLAATQWRLQQARQVIARVRVRLIEQPTKSTRAFVSIEEGSSRRYVMAMQAASDAVMREQLVRTLTAQVGSLMERLRHFEEFADVVAAWEQVAS